MKYYSNFLNRFFLLSLISLILISILNYDIDPSHHFSQSPSYEIKMAESLLHKKNIENPGNYNERLLQKIMFENMMIKPNVLVLGSSRTLTLTHRMFGNDSFYNASVSGASLEDDVALYYLYQNRGWRPKILIISADPWLLNKHNDQDRWREISLAYQLGRTLISDHFSLNTMDQIKWMNKQFIQLLSWDYFMASTKIILSTFFHKSKKYQLTTQTLSSYPIKSYDGTLFPSKNEELTSDTNADRAGIHYAQQSPVYSLGRYTALDPDMTDLFDHFIHYLVNHDIKVILYLPPYEKKAYTEIMANPQYKMVSAAENFFLTLANRYHLKIMGAYDPEKVSLKSHDFIDGMHLKARGVWKIWNANPPHPVPPQ